VSRADHKVVAPWCSILSRWCKAAAAFHHLQSDVLHDQWIALRHAGIFRCPLAQCVTIVIILFIGLLAATVYLFKIGYN